MNANHLWSEIQVYCHNPSVKKDAVFEYGEDAAFINKIIIGTHEKYDENLKKYQRTRNNRIKQEKWSDNFNPKKNG